jgi:ATP-dependent DNA helicase DinG
MAQAVEAAIANRDTLVCEAGTGTGKTYAYLIPALMSGRKVIVSTGTKALQEQLYHRDLPRVRKALREPVRAALLKGRANYLCRYRFEQSLGSPSRRLAAVRTQLESIRWWSARTGTGDTAELAEVPEDSEVWPAVTSTADNCLGARCPVYGDCWVVAARRAALAADLVVINHHLFLADLVLKEEGFGEVLPSAEAVIFDEAHQLPALARRFLGSAISSRQLQDLVQDIVDAYVTEAADTPDLDDAAQALGDSVDSLGALLRACGTRGLWASVLARPTVPRALADLRAALEGLAQSLAPIAVRGPALDRCRLRAETLAAGLAHFHGEAGDGSIRWWEVRTQSYTLHRSPLDVADPLQGLMTKLRCAWVFTSATLSVGGDFDHFKRGLGLTDALDRRWDSPFDYARQTLLYLPDISPEPGAARYGAAVLEAILPVLAASGGRAFLLFTSHQALQAGAAVLRQRSDFPLFVQGSVPRDELLRRFRSTPRAVLMGTNSFWEGVDVPGEALSCVIIDKLPFTSPDEPIQQAIVAALRDQGRNPFVEHQLPQAVIALKQGAGRLIRDADDRGVLVLCDPRLRSRAYGRVFLNSLPAMPVTRRLEDVQAFFGHRPDAADTV